MTIRLDKTYEVESRYKLAHSPVTTVDENGQSGVAHIQMARALLIPSCQKNS